jgi:hypothetical protein
MHMAQMIAEIEVLEALEETTPTTAEYPAQRLEIYDYAVASTLDVAET